MPMPETTYDFYFSSYCGGKPGLLNKEEFDRFIRPATQSVADYITFDGDCLSFQKEIRLCACRVAEALFKGEPQRGIKSETTDGYSVTYDDRSRDGDEIRRIIVSGLKDTGLLYTGVE